MRSAWVLTRRRAKPREQPGREVAFGGMDTFPISMRVPLEQTQGELRGLISSGKAIERELDFPDGDDLQGVLDELSGWVGRVMVFMRQRFNTLEFVVDIIGLQTPTTVKGIQRGLASNSPRRHLETTMKYLRQMESRLPLFDPPPSVPTSAGDDSTALRDVFVVHGHSARWREEVARFVQRIGPDLEVVILKEQPNIGRTLIRKFEDHAAGVAFAVVIATSDDVGAVATALPDSASRSEEIFDVLEPRARQNVVFELGYFFGLIGRSRTVVLLEQGTTEPSDIDGILYIPLDEDGAWKAELGREMKTAGVSVDLNRLA